MEIILNKKEVKGLIKEYYSKNYMIKSCKVKFEAKNIKDKLKEIDLFHNDEVHYNVLFTTTITGKIMDKKGIYNPFEETLDIDSTNDIVARALQQYTDVESVKCGFQFYDNYSTGGLGINFTHMLAKVNENSFQKRLGN